MNLNFPKSERLRHKSLVDALFAEGRNLYEFPLRVKFRALTEQNLEDSFKVSVPEGIAPLQLLITVPKKKRRHAVDRVLMRRRVREAWRLQRRALRTLVEEHPELRTLSVAIIYMCDANLPSEKINAKMSAVISKLSRFVADYKVENTDNCAR